jgi:hypothetical protein
VLLTQHAATHSHFLSSSSLLSTSTSPTAGHFGALLTVLTRLQQAEHAAHQVEGRVLLPLSGPQVRLLAVRTLGSILQAVKGRSGPSHYSNQGPVLGVGMSCRRALCKPVSTLGHYMKLVIGFTFKTTYNTRGIFGQPTLTDGQDSKSHERPG